MKLKKICEIEGSESEDFLEVVKALKNSGFLMVDDDITNMEWKRYYILKEE